MKSQAVPVQQTSGAGPYTFLAILVSSIVGYFLVSRDVKNKRDEKEETASKEEVSKLTTSLVAQQASQFRKFIGNWYQTANEREILGLALKVRDWPGVVRAYSTLYQGDNIETDLRKVLNDSEYTQFIRNVRANGRKMNSQGWFTPINVHKPGTILFLDDSTAPINLTSEMLNLPNKVAHSYQRGKLTQRQKQVSFIQAVDFEYFSGTGKIRYYQVRFDGKPFWVRWQTNISKRQGKAGLTGCQIDCLSGYTTRLTGLYEIENIV